MTPTELSEQFASFMLLTAYIMCEANCDESTAEQIMLHIMDGLDRWIADYADSLQEDAL